MSESKRAKGQVGLTLRDLLISLNPRQGENLDWWFEWPPDLFALTSTFLRDSGAHRLAASPPFHVRWPQHDFHRKLPQEAKLWRARLLDEKSMEDILPRLALEHKGFLEDHLDSFDLRDVYSGAKFERESEGEGVAWKICQAMLELHAMADIACTGLGILRGLWERQEQNRFLFLANMMLSMHSSLSRIPREFGVVLPKMRTPQVGTTLRSLSHHLTFHRTEVDVIWRAVPWMNRDENSLNIMVVPWPFEIGAGCFEPVRHSGTSEELGKARYFSYSPAKENDPAARVGTGDLDEAKSLSLTFRELLRSARRETRNIHMIVFPESSLKREQLAEIQDIVKKEFSYQQGAVPLIVAGLADPFESNQEHLVSNATASNRVSISMYNAHHWYELSQDKHHRWRLDEAQIESYNLGGALTGGKIWWECINLPKRRLSMIAPNGWLALCPLICEDLARLDPVSEIIRGIGPTLLVALLLDGPQIPERWSARYAGVLAEDPGSSVLTVTSLGMVRRAETVRARKRQESTVQPIREEKTYAIALWNDQINGWRPIRLQEDERAAVLSITASSVEEFTSDGRSDGVNASAFALHGYFGVKPDSPVTEEMDRGLFRDAFESGLWLGSNRAKMKNDTDIVELSLFTYYVDSVLDAKAEHAELFAQWFAWMSGSPEEPELRTDGCNAELIGSILEIIRYSTAHYSKERLGVIQSSGENVEETVEGVESIPSKNLVKAREAVAAVISKATGKGSDGEKGSIPSSVSSDETSEKKEPPIAWWRKLYTACKADLENLYSHTVRGELEEADLEDDPYLPPLRIEASALWGILWAIHNRLSRRRRVGRLRFDEAELLGEIEDLQHDISAEMEAWMVMREKDAKPRSEALAE